MFSKINLILGAVLVAIGLCSFVQSTPANETPAESTVSSEGHLMAMDSTAHAAEAESVVVSGSFDIDPVEYPALPPVEGTRINSGKKTSFVKPEEFPAVSDNDYREVMATTPGIIVSEEPSSPIINFGYRGLDSQRSEFMQVLKDGVSIKNEQFGFPETHYTPILDAVERIEFVRAGAALQFGPQPRGIPRGQ
jgi:outer membrane receptor for Fe3+-dicitrate